MIFALWGFDASLALGLPVRSSGYVWFALTLLLTLGLVLRDLIRRSPKASSQASRPLLFLLLLLLAPLASQSLVVHLPALSGLPLPGQGGAPPAASFSVLGALPWLLAGGVGGVTEAALVGRVAGVAPAGFPPPGFV